MASHRGEVACSILHWTIPSGTGVRPREIVPRQRHTGLASGDTMKSSFAVCIIRRNVSDSLPTPATSRNPASPLAKFRLQPSSFGPIVVRIESSSLSSSGGPAGAPDSRSWNSSGRQRLRLGACKLFNTQPLRAHTHTECANGRATSQLPESRRSRQTSDRSLSFVRSVQFYADDSALVAGPLFIAKAALSKCLFGCWG